MDIMVWSPLYVLSVLDDDFSFKMEGSVIVGVQPETDT